MAATLSVKPSNLELKSAFDVPLTLSNKFKAHTSNRASVLVLVVPSPLTSRGVRA